ncbi:unnamed protein product [Cuscuta europaea]|uniref:Uncharacterized protein n=1 Tax=Cuscuta europaea TaxID=41803 RepID=A0A9P0Z3N8_CUSEU|nr:unnamed protein product [Cuscuta europaea]
MTKNNKQSRTPPPKDTAFDEKIRMLNAKKMELEAKKKGGEANTKVLPSYAPKQPSNLLSTLLHQLGWLPKRLALRNKLFPLVLILLMMWLPRRLMDWWKTNMKPLGPLIQIQVLVMKKMWKMN